MKKKMIDNLINIFFENKKEINNIFSDALNVIYNEDSEKYFFFNKLQKYCKLCIQKNFIKGGISNLNLLIKKNFIENNNKDNCLNLVLSKNNFLKEKINEITNDLNNIINKKSQYKKDELKINQINYKIEENIDKLIEIKNILGKINEKSDNISKIDKKSLNNINNIIKIENTEKRENYSDKVENQKEIYKISDTNSIRCQNALKEKSKKLKKYIILTKGFIFESNYEKKQKNKLSKIFQYNSMNHYKNYLHNFPNLINKHSNNIDDTNEKKFSINNNLINTLSDIKSLENNCNLKKSKINHIISPLVIPFRNFSQEVEKKISKLKQADTAINKINNLNEDYNDYNFESENIINNKNIKRNNEFNTNMKKIKTAGNYNDNNNLENNIHNKNLLLKYLISSYEVNQKLLNQINLGVNPLSSIILGINNNNSINDLINTKSFETNFNNNIQNSMNNPINNPINNNFPNTNNLSVLNPFDNNNISTINGNLNFLNNMKSYYNPNLMNNNLNNVNFGLRFNNFNDMPGLKNNIFENLNLFPNNNQMQFQDKFNYINKDLNSILNNNHAQDINSFGINNNIKNENERINNENENKNINNITSENASDERDKDKNENKS